MTGMQHQTQERRLQRYIGSQIALLWTIETPLSPWADFERQLCICLTDKIFFLGTEEGWSLSRGSPCKLVLPLPVVMEEGFCGCFLKEEGCKAADSQGVFT